MLKKWGMLFCVFPSYYFPFGGAHLRFATRMPLIQWFFDPETLNKAYDEIINSRGQEAYWYKNKGEDWKKLHGGIGVNGATFSDFRAIAEEVGFSKICVIPTPIFSVGMLSLKFPIIKIPSKMLKPLLKVDMLQDYLSHSIVAILVA